MDGETIVNYREMNRALCSIGLLPLVTAVTALAVAQPSSGASPNEAAHWKLATTPPMGWNSYDAFGDSVTEAEFLTNAEFLTKHLAPHGWNLAVVDYRWYDPGAHSSNLKDREGAPLSADSFGRLVPAANRFPSAADGKGFKPLADKIHAMGLQFGIHIMRGIPRVAVKVNTPIEGSSFTAQEAANTASLCHWCPDMFGVNASTPAGQAWYDSIFRQYAGWGVDFVKVDDLSHPYSAAEIEAIRKAIDRCGRPIVFSASPGPAPLSMAENLKANANLWRISGDFWDRWSDLHAQFSRLAEWAPHQGPGHWPDADMIPFGKLAIRCNDGGAPHATRFTHEEQRTLMTLWVIARSPLILGGNLPDYDDFSLNLLTNNEVLEVARSGTNARQVFRKGGRIAWMADVPGTADRYLAVFRAGERDGSESQGDWVLSLDELGLPGERLFRDLWQAREVGVFRETFPIVLPVHGAALYRVSPVK